MNNREKIKKYLDELKNTILAADLNYQLLDHKKRFIDRYKNKLEDFFGLPIEEIENEFFIVKKEDTLWGKIKKEEKVKNPIEHIIKL